MKRMITISELKAAAEVISNYCDELWETMPKNADGIYENTPCEECTFYDNCMRRLPLEWEFHEAVKQKCNKREMTEKKP